MAGWDVHSNAPPPPPKPHFLASQNPSHDASFPPPELDPVPSSRPSRVAPMPTSKPMLNENSRQSLVAPVPPPKDNEQSTLNRWLEYDGNSAPTVGLDPRHEKTFVPNDEKMTAYSYGKITSYSDLGKQTVAISVSEVHTDPSSSNLAEERKIFGLRRNRFLTLCFLILILIIAGSVGGGVGANLDTHRKAQIPTVPSSTPAGSERVRYANTGLTAIEWIDMNATLHKRVYYQDKSNKIRESAWDNNTAFDSAWQINTIDGAVKPGTPIAAAAGYPHASHNYSLVKDVFFLSDSDGISARQAPSNNSQAWVDDNFSGLYSGTNSTFLAAYWNQNIQNTSQELVLLFQQDNFANGITQGRYVSNKTTSNPWVVNNFGFSQPKGSTFAMSLVSYISGKHLMLYTVGDGNILQQHEYTISDTDLVPSAVVSLTSESSTGLLVQPQSPLTVVSQDNEPLYTQATLPECTHGDDLRATNLIIYAVPDCSSLVLNAWNCSSGYLDHTPEIQPLQKANTTYLSLASSLDRATGNGSVYVMFDSGRGPQVEEWAVPKRAGEPWVTRRDITTDFGL